MRLTKLAIALSAYTALLVIGAASAQAAWKIEGVAIGAAAHEPVAITKKAGSNLVLHTELLGLKLTLTPEKVECGPGFVCSIDGSNFGINHTTARLRFSNIVVDINEVENKDCTVNTNEILTNELQDEVIMDLHELSGPIFDKFVPKNETRTWFTAELIGAKCPLDEEKFTLRGVLAGEVVDKTGARVATGAEHTEQILRFSAAAQTTGDGELLINKKEAQFTGEFESTLKAPNVGKKFSAS